MEDDRLTMPMRQLINSPSNDVFVSVVTLWEISIKSALGRSGMGAMPISSADAVHEFDEAGFHILTVTARHAVAVQDLPRLHRDPFDRLLIAQAIEEPMRFVTHDAAVAAYSDTIIHF